MRYLSGKKFINRDLAARNVLVDDSLTCKVWCTNQTRTTQLHTHTAILFTLDWGLWNCSWINGQYQRTILHRVGQRFLSNRQHQRYV